MNTNKKPNTRRKSEHEEVCSTQRNLEYEDETETPGKTELEEEEDKIPEGNRNSRRKVACYLETETPGVNWNVRRKLECHGKLAHQGD